MYSDEIQTYKIPNSDLLPALKKIFQIWGLSLRKHTYYVSISLMLLGVILCPHLFWNWDFFLRLIPIPVILLIFGQIQLINAFEVIYSNSNINMNSNISSYRKKTIGWSLIGLIFLIMGSWIYLADYFQEMISPILYNSISVLYSVIFNFIPSIDPLYIGLSIFICTWIIAGYYDLTFIKELNKFLTRSLRNENLNHNSIGKIQAKVDLLIEGKCLLLIPPLALIGLYLYLIAEMDLGELFMEISQ